jgi:hypothetical protein
MLYTIEKLIAIQQNEPPGIPKSMNTHHLRKVVVPEIPGHVVHGVDDKLHRGC